LPELILLNC